MRISKIIPILILVGLLLPSFSFAQNQPIQPPETLEDYNPPTTLPSSMGPSAKEIGKKVAMAPPETLGEVKEIGEKALEVSKKELPGVLEKIWKDEVLPVWQKMYDWLKINIWPKIESWFKKEVQPRVKGEVEKRKPIIKEEFNKEKEELKEEVPKVTKSLWEKFKELIK